jgi:aspartate aminotransferase
MLAERAKTLQGSQTSGMRNRARKLKAAGIRVTNFAAGELDRDTSPIIKDGARQAIDSGRTQYTDTLGIKELREGWAQKVTTKTGVSYAVEEVGFTSGAKQALFNSIFVTFQPGDEVIIPAPYWVTFPEQVRLAGATPVFLSTFETNFQIDLALLERTITAQTRGIILNTPHNPTGAVYGEEVLKGISKLAIQHNLTVIFDECYDELVYTPAKHLNIVNLLPEMKDRTILIGSFSKTYCMAGWRAGFVAGPQAVIKAISNLQSHSASNPCNLVQYAALAALDPANDAFVANVREQLHRQRETAIQLLDEVPGLTFVVPHGAFYLFPDISALLNRSYQGQRIDNVDVLAEMLLEHAHIAVVPGSAFGADRHIRISYAIPLADIATGLKSLDAFVRALV